MKKKQKDMTKEELREYRKRWRDSHPENMARYRETAKRLRAELGITQVYNKEYYEAHKEQYKEACYRWSEKNREHVNSYQRERHKIYKECPEYLEKLRKNREELSEKRKRYTEEKKAELEKKRRDRQIEKTLLVLQKEQVSVEEVIKWLENGAASSQTKDNQ